jgi:hypothetical protein
MTKAKRKTGPEIVAIVNGIAFMGGQFVVMEKGDGYLLQLLYDEPDVETGKIETQKTRKHYVSPWMTETEIVDTAFYCAVRSMEHRAREHFTYKGLRVHSPHFSIVGREQLCAYKCFDRRVD